MVELSSNPRFVGRGEELRRLESGLEAAAAGHPELFVMGGEAGVGKTRLTEEFVARADATGATTLVGGCVDVQEGGLPLGPFVQALRDHARGLDHASREELLTPGGADLARLLPDLSEPAAGPAPAVSASTQGRLFELVSRAAGPNGGRPAAGARARGSALVGSLHARPARVPGAKPPRRADGARGHLPGRRALPRTSAAPVPGRARSRSPDESPRPAPLQPRGAGRAPGGDPGRPTGAGARWGAARAVTTPGGQVLDSPDGPGTALTPAIRILRSAQIKATVVGLQDPKPGSYRIDPMPGSPAIIKVSEASDPLPARVTATVRGRGAHRTLVYDVLRRPNQRVTFVETGPGGHRPIGTVTGGRGTLSFSPAPGTGRRRIEAQFELAGIGAETKAVATFTPPSVHLGRPTHLTVRRRAGRLLIAWTRVTGATRYEIATTLTSGVQRTTHTRRPTATISRVARASGGRVTVRAIAPMRQGHATAARFRANAPRGSTRFGPLPRLKRTTGG